MKNLGIIHDGIIKKYEVDFEKNEITFYIKIEENGLLVKVNDRKEAIVTFKDVFSHKFDRILKSKSNIQDEIFEGTIDDFYIYNKKDIEDKKLEYLLNMCNDSETVEEKLKRENYKYYSIDSILGLDGWVLAKDMTIEY